HAPAATPPPADRTPPRNLPRPRRGSPPPHPPARGSPLGRPRAMPETASSPNPPPRERLRHSYFRPPAREFLPHAVGEVRWGRRRQARPIQLSKGPHLDPHPLRGEGNATPASTSVGLQVQSVLICVHLSWGQHQPLRTSRTRRRPRAGSGPSR